MPEPDVRAIEEAVRRMYAEVARSAEGRFRYATGREGAMALGYDPEVLAGLPDDVLAAFCGVGNPFTLGVIAAGETVLDVGCGAGNDLIVASRLVGTKGAVHGIDLTPEMVQKACSNLARVGITNASVQQARSDAIPYPDETFDVVSSNGVFNLSPRKEETFREIHRVLKRGGRLQFADIVLKEALSPDVAGNLDAWAS
jgi:SAM-dependent methyltransferase